MNRIAKIILKIPIRGGVGKVFNLLNFGGFMRYSVWYYRRLGIKIEGAITYICPDVYFDSADYSAITIQTGVTISREVLFLVHDYSVHTAMVNVGWNAPKGKTAHFIKPMPRTQKHTLHTIWMKKSDCKVLQEAFFHFLQSRY